MFSVINCGEIIAGTAEQKIHPKCWQILHTHCFYSREGENTLKETDIGSDISTDQVILLAAIPLLPCSVSLLLRCSVPLFTIFLRSLLLPCSVSPITTLLESYLLFLGFFQSSVCLSGDGYLRIWEVDSCKGSIVVIWMSAVLHELSVRLQTECVCVWLMFYVSFYHRIWIIVNVICGKIFQDSFQLFMNCFFSHTVTIFHYGNNDAKLLHNRLIFTNSVNFLTQTKQCLSTIGCFFLQLRTSSPDLGSFGLYPSTTLYTSHITEVIQDLMISFINKVLPTLQDSSPAQGETMT